MFPSPQSKRSMNGDLRDINAALFHSLGTQKIREKRCSVSQTLIFTFLWLSSWTLNIYPPLPCHGSRILLKPQVKQILLPLFFSGVLSHWLDK